MPVLRADARAGVSAQATRTKPPRQNARSTCMNETKHIAVLGSTGSIGQSAIKVIQAIDGLHLTAISGHQNIATLIEQAVQLRPAYVVATDPAAVDQFVAQGGQLPNIDGTEFLIGPEELETIATLPQVDTVLAAIVGVAGLQSTFAAVSAGKRVALANKESMVVAGHLLTQLAAETGAEILPVDSEHSAIFQALKSGKPAEVSRVVLTASGGLSVSFPTKRWPKSLSNRRWLTRLGKWAVKSRSILPR